jgi:nitrogen regulatory protein PII
MKRHENVPPVQLCNTERPAVIARRGSKSKSRSVGGREMTKIEAIIKPFRLTEVQQALTELGIQGMTVTEVKGFGRQKGHVELYRGAEYTVNFVPKLYIMTVLPDDLAKKAVDAIQKAAFTGKIGDGKIFLSKIDEAVRIRTKETGSEAL